MRTCLFLCHKQTGNGTQLYHQCITRGPGQPGRCWCLGHTIEERPPALSPLDTRPTPPGTTPSEQSHPTRHHTSWYPGHGDTSPQQWHALDYAREVHSATGVGSLLGDGAGLQRQGLAGQSHPSQYGNALLPVVTALFCGSLEPPLVQKRGPSPTPAARHRVSFVKSKRFLNACE